MPVEVLGRNRESGLELGREPSRRVTGRALEELRQDRSRLIRELQALAIDENEDEDEKGQKKAGPGLSR